MNKKTIGNEPIYDARTLGAPRMFVLGFQHMFAMFGATVLVPTLTGLSVSVTLLFAGLGTLLFHLLAKGKVPAFLGSSFAFLGGYSAIAPMLENPDTPGLFNIPNTEMLPYACFGVACAGLVYLVLSLLFKVFGVRKVMRFFPPIVTGPIIIAIGLSLSSSAVNNCQASWPIALVAILVVIVCNIWGKGMIKIIPILLGVIASYIVGAVSGQVDFTAVREADWIGLPVVWSDTTTDYTLENAIRADMAGQLLSMVYLKKIREDAGAAYSVSAQGALSRVDDKVDCGVYALCPVKPEKADTALAIMRDEIAAMQSGCDADMLAKVKEFMLKNIDDRTKTNGYWQSVIGTFRKYGVDMHTDYKKTVEAQTPQAIGDFIKGLLAPGNRVEVVMLPAE